MNLADYVSLLPHLPPNLQNQILDHIDKLVVYCGKQDSQPDWIKIFSLSANEQNREMMAAVLLNLISEGYD
jgi:hypothetical protein